MSKTPNKRSGDPIRDRIRTATQLAAILFATSLTALWTCFLPLQRVLLGQNDFLAFYTGAKMVGTPLLYSAGAARKLEQAVSGIWLPAVIYIRPPFYAALLRPIAALPYRPAYFLFEALNLAALFVFLCLSARGDKLLWTLGGISIPVVTALANGQDIFLLLLVCFTAWQLEQQEKPFLAGLVFSLLAVKFHVFLFIPVVLVLKKRWRTLGGCTAGGAILFVIAAFADGWNWPVQYFKLLRTPEITPLLFTPPNLRGLLMATIGDAAGVELLITALVALAFIWVTIRMRELGPALALAIAAGLLASYHAYVQDACLLLLIPVFAPRLRLSRQLTLMLIAPPLYFLLMADGPVSAALPLGILVLFAVVAWESLRGDVVPVADRTHVTVTQATVNR